MSPFVFDRVLRLGFTSFDNGGPLPERARSSGTQGRASGAVGRMPPGNASDENQDRLLQGREPQRQVSEYSIRLPRIRLSAPAGSTLQRQHAVLGLQPGGQRLGAEGHAGGDSGTEPPTSDRLAYGRDRTADQSAPAGVDRILRTIRALGSVPFAEIRQSMLLAWAMRKFKRFKAHKIRASRFLQRLAQEKRVCSCTGSSV